MSRKKKSTFTLYAEYIPVRILYAFLHAIPLSAGYALAGFVMKFVYWFDVRHRRRSIQHMLHAGIVRSEDEARALAKKMFREFGKLFVEIVKMDQCYDQKKISLGGSPSAIHDVMDPAGPRRQVIVVTAHYGNWEVAGTAFSDASGHCMTSIMRPFDNPLIGKLILDHRASHVHELADKSNGIRALLKAASAGRHITVLIDQHAAHQEGVLTTFFGHPCMTHKTPALLHLKTKIPIQPEITRRLPGSDYRFELVLGDLIEYEPTGDKEHDIHTITQLCTTAIEKLISDHPEQWMWAARRWIDINRKHTSYPVPEEQKAPPAEK